MLTLRIRRKRPRGDERRVYRGSTEVCHQVSRLSSRSEEEVRVKLAQLGFPEKSIKATRGEELNSDY
jgi:hypothetical protein